MPTDVEKLIATVLAQQPRPKQADALARLGEELQVNGELDPALACFDRALRENPSFARAWVGRAAILATKNRNGEALGCIERALDAEPGFPPAIVQKAELLAKSGARSEALALFDQAAEKDPDSAAIWEHRAKLLDELDRPDDAIASLERALELTDSGALRAQLAQLFVRVGRFEDAARSYERAVMMESDVVDHWYALGRAKTKVGRNADAKTAFERFLALAPTTDRRYATARSLLEDVAKKPAVTAPIVPPPPARPEPSPLPRPSAPVSAPKIETKRDSEAPRSRPTPTPPPTSSPKPPDATSSDRPPIRPSHKPTASGTIPAQVYGEVRALAAESRYVEALRRLEPLVKRLPDRLEGWTLRAMLLEKLAQHDAAITSAERALRIDAGSVEALKVLVAAAAAAKKDARALEAADKLVAAAPDDAEAHRIRARQLVTMLKHPLAVPEHQRAVELAPDDAEAWLELGRTLRQLRRTDDARSALKKAESLAHGCGDAKAASEAKALLEKLG